MAKAELKIVEDKHELEYTRARIYAYLHALQPMDGCEVGTSYHRGRELVAILAETSNGYGMPRRRLTLDECAEVIGFMHSSEPRNRATFYKDLPGKPSVECGYHFVLLAVEEAIRKAVQTRVARKAA